MGHPPLYVTFSDCSSVRPSICREPYLKNHTSSDHNFYYTRVKWWYLHIFLSFFQDLMFWVVSGVKEQKMTQNDPKWQKISSVALHMVHMCKMIISWGYVFHFFKILIFWVVSGVKWQKIVPLHISWTIHHMIVNCDTQV